MEIIADVLTKQGSRKEDLDGWMEKNVFRQAINKDILAKCMNDEIYSKNFTTKLCSFNEKQEKILGAKFWAQCPHVRMHMGLLFHILYRNII